MMAIDEKLIFPRKLRTRVGHETTGLSIDSYELSVYSAFGVLPFPQAWHTNGKGLLPERTRLARKAAHN